MARKKPQGVKFPGDTGTASIDDGNVWFEQNVWKHKTHCAMCDRSGEWMHRKISSSQSYTLALLAKLIELNIISQTEAHYVSKLVESRVSDHRTREWLKGHRDPHRLKHWGLLKQAEPPEGVSGETRKSYFYVTDLGLLFANGKAYVEESVWIYNDEVMKHEGLCRIHDTIDNLFDFDELFRKPLDKFLAIGPPQKWLDKQAKKKGKK